MNIHHLLALVVFVPLFASNHGRGRFGFRIFLYRYTYSNRGSHGSLLSSSNSVRDAIVDGTVYGANTWRLRRPDYYHNDDALPTICYNDKYNRNESGNVPYYGRFVCPEDYQGFDYKYCCGKKGFQYCCTFLDDYRRVLVLVAIIILAVGGLIFFIFLVVKSMRAKSCLSSRLRNKMDVRSNTLKSGKEKKGINQKERAITDPEFKNGGAVTGRWYWRFLPSGQAHTQSHSTKHAAGSASDRERQRKRDGRFPIFIVKDTNKHGKN